MPATAWGWEIAPEELESWILKRTPELIVLNKPPRVVCHPSRYGPWSSLIGAVREYLCVDRLHMPSRLDRETSGVLVFARNRETGRRLQNAVLRGRVKKTYIAILEGNLYSDTVVDQPIGRDADSPFFSRRGVAPDGQPAVTEFEPIARACGHTMVRVHPRTGRRHQIRVHAAWLGHPVAGDKLYGPDPGMMLRLMEKGFLDEELAALPVPRHFLHAAEVIYGNEKFEAPLFTDIAAFWERCQSGR
jgi:23S rRNA pseudouridine1911/1915/1917 synthase